LKWLQGNKSFTITFKTKYRIDGLSKEILINDTYTLSDDGKTLTINEFHKAELGETKTTDVSHKKQYYSCCSILSVNCLGYGIIIILFAY
jgi:hypothetical protein